MTRRKKPPKPYTPAELDKAIADGMAAAVDEEEAIKREAAEYRKKHGRPRFDPEKREYVEDVIDDY